MTEDVLVRIKGMQITGQEEDGLEVVTQGKYMCRNGKHYVSYEEMIEGLDGTIQNFIKVDEDTVEVTKRGLTNVHMVFEKDKKNVTCYETPFGSMMVGIFATGVDVKDSGKDIDVTVNYTLDINEAYLADCTVSVNVRSK